MLRVACRVLTCARVYVSACYVFTCVPGFTRVRVRVARTCTRVVVCQVLRIRGRCQYAFTRSRVYVLRVHGFTRHHALHHIFTCTHMSMNM